MCEDTGGVYVVWRIDDAQDGCSILVCTADRDPLADGLIEPGAYASHCIRGDSWEAVMAAHHAIQGWEPYVPF
jgi:hypothetical protein